MSAAGSSRDEVAAIARRLTADLARLHTLAVEHSGAEKAAERHQNAATGLHHLIAATGVYGGSR